MSGGVDTSYETVERMAAWVGCLTHADAPEVAATLLALREQLTEARGYGARLAKAHDEDTARLLVKLTAKDKQWVESVERTELFLRETAKALGMIDDAGETPRADEIVVRAGARRQLSVTKALEAIARHLPCRVIPNEHGPYLSRYTLAERPDGSHVYLHFFHRSDADHELHNHPWSGESLILAGGYREQYLKDGEVLEHVYEPGDLNVLGADTFHRVDLTDEARGCWTLFSTGPKAQSWGFLDVATRRFTPWRDALRARGLLGDDEPAAALSPPCTCRDIQATDEGRHFKGCTRRDLYPPTATTKEAT